MTPNPTVLDIAFPKDGRIRSRRVVTRSRARPTGQYPSLKMGRMMQWESEHERNAFRLLDADPKVVRFREQPMVIRFAIEGQIYKHHPDILVDFRDAREIWEVKTEADAFSDDVMKRTQLLQSAMPRLGYTYRVVTGESLSSKPRLSNILVLLQHGRAPVGTVTRDFYRQIFRRIPTVPWEAALNGDLGPNAKAVLCRLTLEGVLEFDLLKPLTSSTTFTWVESDK